MQNCTANGNKVARAEIATPAPIRPMDVDLPYRGVSATAGTVALYTVTIHRGPTPLSGVRLLLHGSREIPGGAQAELNANTDRDGHATFSIPAGTTAGNYNLKIADADGVELHGVIDFVLTTIPAAPSLAKVSPQTLDIGAGARGTRDITVTVTDPFANPVPQLPVVLKRYPRARRSGASDADHRQRRHRALRHPDRAAAGRRQHRRHRRTIAPYATLRVTAAAEITNLLIEAERQLSEGSLSGEGAYDSVLTVDPNNARALIGRGYIRSAQGKYEAATQDFTAALNAPEERANALTGLGYLALRRNDLATASARFDEALKLDPSDKAPRPAARTRSCGDSIRGRRRIAPQRSRARAPCRIPPHAANAAARRHRLLRRAQCEERGEFAHERGELRRPSWPDVYYERALVYQAEGQHVARGRGLPTLSAASPERRRSRRGEDVALARSIAVRRRRSRSASFPAADSSTRTSRYSASSCWAASRRARCGRSSPRP